MRNSKHICAVKHARILALTRMVILVVGFLILYTPIHAACPPTQRDALGPFYKPNAPMRSKVGTGYVLQGVVQSAVTCQPLPGALVELWMAGPDGRYQDAYRARLKAEKTGHYRFESHIPVGYYGRPPHIHIRVTAAGHQVLVTQHYPPAGDQPVSKTGIRGHLGTPIALRAVQHSDGA